MQMPLKMSTKSDTETRKIGTILAETVFVSPPYQGGVRGGKGAIIISLEGDLGAGKTTFAKGFAEGLGVREIIQSPTFVILKIYNLTNAFPSLRRRGSGRLIHVDAYRIGAKDMNVLGWHDFIKNPKNIILIEWGDRIKKILPKDTIHIIFKHTRHEHERSIVVQ